MKWQQQQQQQQLAVSRAPQPPRFPSSTEADIAAERERERAIGRNLVSVWSIRPPIPGLAMDEQAGPGVFFNNNNNSVLPGGAKAPQPGDGGETARAQYSIPGILHFLQHEWARFEVERAQWEVERAELQVTRPLWPLFSEVFWTLCAKSHNQTFVGLFFLSRADVTRARAHAQACTFNAAAQKLELFSSVQ